MKRYKPSTACLFWYNFEDGKEGQYLIFTFLKCVMPDLLFINDPIYDHMIVEKKRHKKNRETVQTSLGHFKSRWWDNKHDIINSDGLKRSTWKQLLLCMTLLHVCQKSSSINEGVAFFKDQRDHVFILTKSLLWRKFFFAGTNIKSVFWHGPFLLLSSKL